jgi:hypothetical protein
MEAIMTERDFHVEDVIDLGVASEETRGGNNGTMDTALSLQPQGGISDD